MGDFICAKDAYECDLGGDIYTGEKEGSGDGSEGKCGGGGGEGGRGGGGWVLPCRVSGHCRYLFLMEGDK